MSQDNDDYNGQLSANNAMMSQDSEDDSEQLTATDATMSQDSEDDSEDDSGLSDQNEQAWEKDWWTK